MQRFVHCYAEGNYAECRYAKCRYHECRNGECRGAIRTCLKLLLSKHKYFDLINRSKLRISNLQQIGNFKLITFTVVKI